MESFHFFTNKAEAAKNKKPSDYKITRFKMAGARGLEPGTNGFGDRYSTS